jgi:hypothetical protein
MRIDQLVRGVDKPIFPGASPAHAATIRLVNYLPSGVARARLRPARSGVAFDSGRRIAGADARPYCRPPVRPPTHAHAAERASAANSRLVRDGSSAIPGPWCSLWRLIKQLSAASSGVAAVGAC